MRRLRFRRRRDATASRRHQRPTPRPAGRSRRQMSRISQSLSFDSRVSTGVTTSTRLDRLRNIQSADPIKNSPCTGSSETRGEIEDAGVLEKTSDNGPNPNVFGTAGLRSDEGSRSRERSDRSALRPAADASHRGLDQLRVLELIHLGDDARRKIGSFVRDFPLDQFHQTAPHGGWRHQQLRESRRVRVPGQVMEKIHDVLRNRRIAGEQPEIGIEARGAHMIIAGPDMDVTSQPRRTLLRTTSASFACVFRPSIPNVT